MTAKKKKMLVCDLSQKVCLSTFLSVSLLNMTAEKKRLVCD